MATSSHAKILIAGGSVAGLGLANALEQIGVDFLVLEKYGEIGPDLGASIGMFPNGLRILDQLGCQDAIQDLVKGADAFKYMGMRDSKGREKNQIVDASQHFIKRLGYSPIFVDRQMLIKVLYDNLKDKSKVLTGKGVVKVELSSKGVNVLTKDGSKFTGEVLVGADGIHSTVRREMWRIADTEKPGYFPLKERDNVPTTYCCIFGISKPLDKFIQFSSQVVEGRNCSYLVASGPESRIYWFLFKKLEQVSFGLYEKIPRFTDAEMNALAAEHENDHILEDLRFGEIYKARSTATLQALPEVVFSKWHYRRIITIGDAAHKFNPIGGQGGNSAMEDVAALTNELHSLVQSGMLFTNEAITQMFARMQSQRFDRAQLLCKTGHMMQSINAQDSLISRLIAGYMIPSETEPILELVCATSQPAALLKTCEVPRRAHYETFHDERPATNLSDQFTITVRVLTSTCFVIMLYLAHVFMAPNLDGLLPNDFLGNEPLSRFTGISALDKILKIILVIFGEFVGWSDVGVTVQFLNLLLFLTPILLIWYVEGNRNSAKSSLLLRPAVYGVLMNFLGIGKVAPLYFLISTWATSNGSYINSIGRHVPTPIAKSLTPSIFLAYVVPTLLMFAPNLPSIPHQILAIEWQFTVILISVLIHQLSTRLFKFNKTDNNPTEKRDLSSGSAAVASYYSSAFTDVPHLLATYKTTFIFSLLYHVAFLTTATLSNNPLLALPRLLNPFIDLSKGSHGQTHSTSLAEMFVFAKWDFIFAAVAVFLYGSYAVFDLRSRGLITTSQLWNITSLFVIGQVVVGPGAAVVGLWWWREAKIAGSHAVSA